MDIVFFQTADAGYYFDLLSTTSRTVRAYCEAQGCAYEAFVGIKRGHHPWHASYNRIYMLDELRRQGRYDWAVYLDADAFVSDLSFDLKRYLSRKSRFAAVLTPSGATKHRWDVNDGVVIVNLRHPFSARLIGAWRTAHEAIPDAVLRAQRTWSNPDDQEMLQAFLRDDPDADRMVHLAPRKLMNSVHARFIRQLVRAHYPDPEARLRALKVQTDAVLKPDPAADDTIDAASAERFIQQIYEGVLRRPADGAGLLHFVPLVQRLGFEAAARFVIGEMLKSPEFAMCTLALRERTSAAEDGA